MVEIPELDSAGLRRFGLTTAGIVIGLFGLVLPLLTGHPYPTWPWIVSSLLAGWALVAPASLDIIYQPWMKVGAVLGWINTRIILGIVFVLIIVPLGKLLRLINERKVARMISGFNRSAASYWIAADSHHHPNMEKPF